MPVKFNILLTNLSFISICLPCLQSNNDVLLFSMRHRMQPTLTLNSDSTEVVQRMSLHYFNTTTFTSYTEIIPGSSNIVVDLQQGIHAGGKILKGRFDTCGVLHVSNQTLFI